MAATKKKSSTPKKKTAQSAPRKLKQSAYKSFRMSKRIKPTAAKLPSSWKIWRGSLGILKNNWKLFLGITLIYGILTIILVRGIGGSLNLSQLKSSLTSGFSGSLASLGTATALFTYLVGSAGASGNPAGGTYQTLLIIIVSLATIWALRQVLADNAVRIRDSFYNGMYPLIPFILILLVIGLQLIPLLLGSWLYSTVISNNIAATSPEKVIWFLIFILLAILSLYMICSSLFALYIVTLPDMTPVKALRSARQLVLHRRWIVIRKIIFLPLALLIIVALIIFPLILFLTAAAEWVFFFLSMFLLIVVHAYMYSLYRELLV
jgi:hypothetical protein